MNIFKKNIAVVEKNVQSFFGFGPLDLLKYIAFL